MHKNYWEPTQEIISKANITQFMSKLGFDRLADFHRWSVLNFEDFWRKIISELAIEFKIPYQAICNLNHGIESPSWLPGASLNITDSCFFADSSNTAITYADPTDKSLKKISYGELNELSNRVANSLIRDGFKPGDAISIIMPLTPFAVALYLGVIKIGGVVVSIADSFSKEEIATRLTIANTKLVFTQDYICWGGKKIPLCEKISIPKISFPAIHPESHEFLSDITHFNSIACEPMQPCNILFSSGTTGTPKAIPWNHTTPIKVASDAFFHHNIQPGDVLAWPTNLGWMMGPWLLFAALINRATIALYTESPKEKGFGQFVQDAKVTMLGVVPTLVAAWKQSKCMEEFDWHSIKVFSSSGECSNVEDMTYLMNLAGNKPVIEYCGGTEIGGAYISSTVIEKNYPALFSTPTMGLDFLILDEQGNPSNVGEVAIIPPSIGLSTTLLNANHHQVYYENMPSHSGTLLRRHGDQIEQLENGYYCMLGRVDDTMNLGGIKISAAEIERSLKDIPEIIEVAAIAVNHNGPSKLVIYAATGAELDKDVLHRTMQERINELLNPLFKIHDVILVPELPKTASNKIMRRTLREMYK